MNPLKQGLEYAEKEKDIGYTAKVRIVNPLKQGLE